MIVACALCGGLAHTREGDTACPTTLQEGAGWAEANRIWNDVIMRGIVPPRLDEAVRDPEGAGLLLRDEARG